jgi:hypothetical protein
MLLGESGTWQMLRFDVAGAPWQTARGCLALPVAVAMLCLILVSRFPDGTVGRMVVLLFLVAAAVAVFGRRLVAVLRLWGFIRCGAAYGLRRVS